MQLQSFEFYDNQVKVLEKIFHDNRYKNRFERLVVEAIEKANNPYWALKMFDENAAKMQEKEPNFTGYQREWAAQESDYCKSLWSEYREVHRLWASLVAFPMQLSPQMVEDGKEQHVHPDIF